MTRSGQPSLTVATTWLFQEKPSTGGTTFAATVTGAMPATLRTVTATVVPPEPGQPFNVTGFFADCAQGVFGATGKALRTTITAAIDGVSCPDSAVFGGSLTLTKQGN